MGARSEALAKKFEGKAEEATQAFERLSEADWRKTTAAEKWTVGVVAHHIAVSHETLGNLIKAVAAGQGPNVPMDAIHAMNAKHAQEHASCTKAETIALHRKNAAAAATLVRGLDDSALEQSANVIAGMPPMSAGQLAGGLLVGHIDEHLKSIQATVGG